MKLSQDEVILYEGQARVPWLLIVTGILTLVLIIGIFFLAFAYFSYKQRFYITNRRIVIEGTGVTREVLLSKIESTQISGKWIFIWQWGKRTDITALRDPENFYAILSEQIQ